MRGKARTPYEFGVKVSLTTTNKRAKGGQFILHAKALPGNPYDGHTLKEVIEETETLTGREIERAYVDKGYVGHDAPKSPTGSSNRARSAASTARSKANSGGDPLSSPSSAIAKQTAIWGETSSKAAQATASTPS